jgi:tRNA(Ile)-lysidine synthase
MVDPSLTEECIRLFVKEKELVSKGENLLLAVSGGADSICMLYALNELKQEMDINLFIAHLDHRLRGKESADDARYVASLAKELDIQVRIEKRNVKAYQKKKGISQEDAAREVRYAFLKEAADSFGCSKVAVGHTRDDHVETILMHIIRGSGTSGLRGLEPLTDWRLPDSGNLTVIRPLLSLSREDTQAYCQRKGIEPRMDSTNLSLSLFRNKIRLELLPVLNRYNPQIEGALTRLSEIASDDIDFIDKGAIYLKDEVIYTHKGVYMFRKESLKELYPALKRGIVRLVLEELYGSLKDVEARHIEEIIAALDLPAGRSINLPDGVIFSVGYDDCMLGRELSTLVPFPPLQGEREIKLSGITELPGWQIETAVTGIEALKEEPKDLTAYLDCGKTGKRLLVRQAKLGDRFYPLGLGSEKKLGRFMIDEKIPRHWRINIPVVCSEKQIIWLVGYRIDERVKVTKDTASILRIEFRRA